MSQVSGVGHSAGSSSSGTSTADAPSVGELFGHVTEDISTLIRQEVALAKAEATVSAKKAGKGAGMLAGAAVGGHFVLLFLSIALWWALGNLFDSNGLSAIVVAILWAIVAGVLAAVGLKQLKQVDGLPRTAETVKKAPNALKGQEEKNL